MTRYRVRAEVLRAPLQEDEVLLNPETGIYHLANVTGRAVLAALQAGDTVATVADRIARDTGTAPERVRQDVEAFVQAMTSRGVLEEVRE